MDSTYFTTRRIMELNIILKNQFHNLGPSTTDKELYSDAAVLCCKISTDM